MMVTKGGSAKSRVMGGRRRRRGGDQEVASLELEHWCMIWRLCLQGYGQQEEVQDQKSRLTVLYQLCGQR